MRLGKALAVGVAEDVEAVEAVTSAEEFVAVPGTVAECEVPEQVSVEVPEPVSVEVPERHPVPAGR
ncbi:hypothetical protein ADL21_25030 [Streptomyces albus subsp. albus]|nr:hypothetical protein ADL21_25030 [Streptomyces albus subsp. albus]